MLKDRIPLQAVAFTAEALRASPPGSDAPEQTRPGARRLVNALRAQGLHVAVLTGHERNRGETAARLARLDLHDLSTLAAPNRTLVVTGPTEPGLVRSVPSLAGAVVAVPDEPLAKPVLAWLAARIGNIDAAAAMIAPLDAEAANAAIERHLRLTKPPNSLGRVETLGVQLAGISGQLPPPPPRPATVAVFAGDHGVHAQRVSPWPQEVTSQMVFNFLAGGAAVNVLAGQVGADVIVVDVGVLGDLPRAPDLLDRKVACGTRDLAQGPAMTPDETRQALEIGIEVAAGLVARGARCLLTGDMGIANTTPAAALTVAFTHRPAGAITGRGSGLPEAHLPRKATIVAEAAARACRIHGDDPVGILSEVGGLEHAAIAGYILGGAALGMPVVIDGAIAASALLVASRMVPGVETTVIAGHRSAEPSSSAVLETLGLEPVVDLDMCLGEGTGAVLALPVLEAARAVLDEMATFDQAGVSAKEAPD